MGGINMNYTRLTNLDVDGKLNVDGNITIGGKTSVTGDLDIGGKGTVTGDLDVGGTLTVDGSPITPGGGGATVATALLDDNEGALIGVVEYTPSEFLDACMGGPAVVTAANADVGAQMAMLVTSAMCVGGTYSFVIGSYEITAASADDWESQQ